MSKSVVPARHETRCEECGWTVARGEPVVRNRFGQWVHEGCDVS